jgi:hypothetical protein
MQGHLRQRVVSLIAVPVFGSGILRYTSGAAFTISDSSVDVNRNGILTDPLPAGRSSGTGASAITVESKGGITRAVQIGARYAF